MRLFWVVIHRWLGLTTAAFLFLTGITGAVIAWDHEIDEWLNADLMSARTPGPMRDPLQLAREIEDRYPQVQVTSIALAAEPGHSLSFGVSGRIDPNTRRLSEPVFNEIFVDPASGEELGKREWGAVWPVTRETFVSFLYRLHYTLHLPEMWGVNRWGIWLLGIVALIWTFDCFAGLYLTLPIHRRASSQAMELAKVEHERAIDEPCKARMPIAAKSWWQRWKPAWKIRVGAGSYRLNFDLHRAVSLWTWLLLLILAFTSFSLNLYREVFYPAMSLVSKVTPSPFDLRSPASRNHPVEPGLGYAELIAVARQEAMRRGWTEPAGAISYAARYGIYSVRFFHAEDGHGAGGVGPAQLYFDGQTGELLGDRLPWKGTTADVFLQAQFPLHSGRILGLPGRIMISLMGLVVAMLSVTGVIIWARKRRARAQARIKRTEVHGAAAASQTC